MHARHIRGRCMLRTARPYACGLAVRSMHLPRMGRACIGRHESLLPRGPGGGKMADEGTVFEQVEHQIINSATDAANAFAESRQRRLRMLAALDRRFAWIVTCLPAAGFVVAMGLAVAGFAPTLTILAIWLGMH